MSTGTTQKFVLTPHGWTAAAVIWIEANLPERLPEEFLKAARLYFLSAFRAAVANEREACADIAEELFVGAHGDSHASKPNTWEYSDSVKAAIQQRGENQ